MMRTTRTVRRATGVAGAILLLAGGIAATQATGDGSEPPTRAAALLKSTQAELADTQHSVNGITLQHVVDGREVYALTGTDTACILVAGVDQDLGRSQSLACTNAALAEPERPLRTGFATASGGGYVDLVWVGGNRPAQVSTSGAPVSVQLGSQVISAARTDDSAASGLAWQAPTTEPVAVELPSRADRDAQASAE